MKTKPNFIVIYCDDLGYGDLGCYGSGTVKTPVLDAMAHDGIRFTNWYSNSPVCSPSRASLLTGKYPARAGVGNILGGKKGTSGLPPCQATLASRLKNIGYQTALFGKWHLGMAEESSPNNHGFDEFFGFKSGCIDYYSHIYYSGQSIGVNPLHDLWDNDTEAWENGRYMTHLITDKSVDFIKRQAEHEDPFFLFVSYNAPHFPMHAPREYMDRFAHLPWDRQVMAAMIAAIDDGVSRIVDALKQSGNYEDTVIFFSSDNGPSAESRNWLDGTEDAYYGGSAGIFRGHKASLFEGGIREPAILSWPGGMEGGRINGEVAATMDIVPTFLDIAGMDSTEGPWKAVDMDGSSLKGLLLKDEPSPHKQIFWEYKGQLAVREGAWKLVLDGKLDFRREAPEPVHLSDLSQDPGERINLAAQHPEIVERLSRDVRAWYTEVTGSDK